MVQNLCVHQIPQVLRSMGIDAPQVAPLLWKQFPSGHAPAVLTENEGNIRIIAQTEDGFVVMDLVVLDPRVAQLFELIGAFDGASATGAPAFAFGDESEIDALFSRPARNV